jgi:hypothetical protein
MRGVVASKTAASSVFRCFDRHRSQISDVRSFELDCFLLCLCFNSMLIRSPQLATTQQRTHKKGACPPTAPPRVCASPPLCWARAPPPSRAAACCCRRCVYLRCSLNRHSRPRLCLCRITPFRSPPSSQGHVAAAARLQARAYSSAHSSAHSSGARQSSGA